MNKSQQIYKYLHQRPLIKVNQLFIDAGMDSGNASRMWAKQADIPERFIPKILAILELYGFKNK